MDTTKKMAMENEPKEGVDYLEDPEDVEDLFEYRTIHEWIKCTDQENSLKVIEWAVKNPAVVAQPYNKRITEGEFIQILIFVIGIFSNKMTFEETPVFGWTEISKVVGLTPTGTRKMANKYNMPIAILGKKPYSTKEKLTVWMNSLIDIYPFFDIKNEEQTRIEEQKITDSKIEALNDFKKHIINNDNFDVDTVLLIDKQIEKEREELEQIVDALKIGQYSRLRRKRKKQRNNESLYEKDFYMKQEKNKMGKYAWANRTSMMYYDRKREKEEKRRLEEEEAKRKAEND